MNYFDLLHAMQTDPCIMGAAGATAKRPRYEALCKRLKVLHEKFAMPKFVPPMPKGVEIDAMRTIQEGATNYDGQWRSRDGSPAKYPDVQRLYHYSDSSHYYSFLENSILSWKDLARLKKKDVKSSGRR